MSKPTIRFERTDETQYDVLVNGVNVGWIERQDDSYVDVGILQSSCYALYVWTFMANDDVLEACTPKRLSFDGVKWAAIRREVRAFLATPMARAFV